METKLIYLEDMSAVVSQAVVLETLEEDEKSVIILDQTIFYPQGGGQPFDTGKITTNNCVFSVTEVRFVGGKVKHIGKYETVEKFKVGDNVSCVVDQEKRILHSRIHSAGHVVDMGLKRLGIGWKPGKGYHFPNGPYVEYSGDFIGVDLDKIKEDLDKVCNDIISQNISTKILFLRKDEMGSVCDFVPDYIPEGKPGRVVMYGDFGIPCGGTHVGNLKEIDRIIIRKIKRDGENVRVSYVVE